MSFSVTFGLTDDVQLLTKGHAPVSEAAACVPHLSCFMTFELLHYGTPTTAFLLFIFYLPVPVKAVECVLYFFL